MVFSFRHRLALRYSIIIASILILFSITLYFVISKSLMGDMRQSLESVVIVIQHELEEYITEGVDNPIDFAIKETQTKIFRTDVAISIFDLEMNIKASSTDHHKIITPKSKILFFKSVNNWDVSYSVEKSEFKSAMQLMIPIKVNNIGYIIVLERSLSDLEATLSKLRFVLEFLVIFSLLVTAYSGIFLARQALEPITRITQTARSITEKNLQSRLPFLKDEGELTNLTNILNEMLDRLEGAFKTQKVFLGDASHEIRSPLTIMKGNFEVMLRRERSIDDYKETLQSNLEEINRLTRIVNDLLILARAGSPEDINRIETVNLDKILQNIVSKFYHSCQEKNIQLFLDALDMNSFIEGDKDKLLQLFSNLVENAIRYTSEKGKINITISKDNHRSYISIKDTGIGIERDELPRIFDRFYRTDKARTRISGGAGLGLSICKYIVESHKGSINVASKLGVGTTFTVTFMLSKPSFYQV